MDVDRCRGEGVVLRCDSFRCVGPRRLDEAMTRSGVSPLSCFRLGGVGRRDGIRGCDEYWQRRCEIFRHVNQWSNLESAAVVEQRTRSPFCGLSTLQSPLYLGASPFPPFLSTYETNPSRVSCTTMLSPTRARSQAPSVNREGQLPFSSTPKSHQSMHLRGSSKSGMSENTCPIAYTPSGRSNPVPIPIHQDIRR